MAAKKTKGTAKPAPAPRVAQKSSTSGGRTSKVAASRAPAPAPEKKARADWPAIERDYRTGKFTDQELADKHGNLITRQAISKMAKSKGWQKDLSDAVRRATNAKLIADEAEKKVAEQVAQGCAATTDTVLIAAEVNKQVILGHRADIHRARKLANSLLDELTDTSVHRERLQELMEVMASGAELTERQLADARTAYADLTRLPTRILGVQRLSQAMAKLQAMERTAFGLDEKDLPPPVDDVADLPDEELDAKIEAYLARTR